MTRKPFVLIWITLLVIVVSVAGHGQLVDAAQSARKQWMTWGNAATNPSINFLGTTDAQPLILKTNGNEAMRIDSNGRVGIGTTNPQGALQTSNDPEQLDQIRVNGTGGSFLRIRKGVDATSNGLIETIKAGSFRSALYINANEPNDVIIAQGGGKVGIGLHPHVGAQAPQAKLHVKLAGADDIEVARFESNEGRLVLVDKDGNVGIGTTNPQSSLQISGYAQLDLTSGAPPAADCDEVSERGRMKVDNVAGSLYICVNSGWVSK